MAPPLCTMSADFFLPDGRPLYRMSLQIQLTYDYGKSVHTDGAVDGQVFYYTDEDGHVDVPFVQGLSYAVRLSVCPDVRYHFTAPETATADLFDYLFPYVQTIEMSADSYSLGEGETTGLAATGTFSDGVEADVTSAVTFETADEAVASVTGNTLTGVAAGATTVNVADVNEESLPAREDTFEAPFLTLPSPTYSIGSAKDVDVV